MFALLAAGISFCVLAFFYHEVLFHPNDYVFAPNGDGIKNYYAYLFHARYDESFWQFGGMNYPYYEHMVYTDGHPLLSWLIHITGFSDYGIGILNLAMLLSFPLCTFFLLRIFRHYGVETMWAIAASIIITFLSPQVYRMTGHLSLAYVFAIPGMWWLLIQAIKKQSFLWSFGIALYLMVFFFTHPYLGMILAFLSIFYWLTATVLNKKSWKKNCLHVLVQVILPLLIFQVLVAITDTHENRLGEPAGFFNYYASWKSVFVPHDGPLAFLARDLKVNIGNWESWNYVGFFSVIFGWIILIYVLRKRKEFDLKNLIRKEIAVFMIAAWLILLFAFCFPLKYSFLRDVVDLFGPLKQFRVLGRFAWVFYYVFTVFLVVSMHQIYRREKKKIVYPIVFYGGMLFGIFEFYPVHTMLSNVVSQSKNVFHQNELTDEMNDLIGFVKQEKFDAILFLPFQHMSSENIMLLGTEQGNYDAFLLSYHTGLPLMNAVTSRMSMTEAIKFNNFFSPEFIGKELCYDLPEDVKIAIVKNQDGIKYDERRLVHSSKKIFENGHFKVFEYNNEAWNTRYYFDELTEADQLANVDVGMNWRADTNAVWFTYESFDAEQGENFAGGGAMHKTKGGYDVVYELPVANLDSGMYTVSFWYYLGVDRPDVLAVAEQDSIGDRKGLWFDTFEVSQSTFIVNNWCFVSMDFYVSPDIEKLNLLITGNGNGEPFYLDELLIYKSAQADLFRYTT